MMARDTVIIRITYMATEWPVSNTQHLNSVDYISIEF